MLSEKSQYALPEEKQILKKQLIRSKNNILMDEFEKPIPKRKARAPKSKKSQAVGEEFSIISDFAQQDEILDMMENDESVLGEDQPVFESRTPVRNLGAPVRHGNREAKSPSTNSNKSTRNEAPLLSTHSTKPSKPVPVSVSNGLGRDEDLEDIVDQIVLLTQELQYYEQLAGKKSVFDLEVGCAAATVTGGGVHDVLRDRI